MLNETVQDVQLNSVYQTGPAWLKLEDSWLVKTAAGTHGNIPKEELSTKIAVMCRAEVIDGEDLFADLI